METALIARGLDGDAKYQQRARKALPILVRQAHAKATISYADLAAELDMTNPRTLNYPLGSVGNAIRELAAEWGEDIPIINCLVVNQESGVPGDGISDFVKNRAEFTKLSRRKKRAIIEAVLSHVFAYPRWEEVLHALELEPLTTRYESEIAAAAAYRGGGESDIHKAFKSYVAHNPHIVGLTKRAGPGTQEYPLPSGDCIDVFFFASISPDRCGSEVSHL